MKTKPKKTPAARGPKLARILVPTDFSLDAAQALRYAVPLARQIGGKITLRILVPVDFSGRTKAAVQYASGLAQTMHARLALVHVVAPLAARSSRFRAEFKQHAAETNLDARNL